MQIPWELRRIAINVLVYVNERSESEVWFAKIFYSKYDTHHQNSWVRSEILEKVSESFCHCIIKLYVGRSISRMPSTMCDSVSKQTHQNSYDVLRGIHVESTSNWRCPYNSVGASLYTRLFTSYTNTIHEQHFTRCVWFTLYRHFDIKRSPVIMVYFNWKFNYDIHNSFHWPRHLCHIFSFIESIRTFFDHKKFGMNWCDVNLRKSLLNWEMTIWQFNVFESYATLQDFLTIQVSIENVHWTLKTILCRFGRFQNSFFTLRDSHFNH